MITIILDTNVLFSGLYSSDGASYRILDAIADKKIKIILSTTLLFEYEEILIRNKKILGLGDNEIEKILDNLCALGDFQKIYFLWRPQLSDPKDDHILELAIASNVKFIVTHNIKDFKQVTKFGIHVLTPKHLLEKIK
jgi:putative PIN family toxin of toxin-antitoxin system